MKSNRFSSSDMDIFPHIGSVVASSTFMISLYSNGIFSCRIYLTLFTDRKASDPAVRYKFLTTCGTGKHSLVHMRCMFVFVVRLVTNLFWSVGALPHPTAPSYRLPETAPAAYCFVLLNVHARNSMNCNAKYLIHLLDENSRHAYIFYRIRADSMIRASMLK